MRNLNFNRRLDPPSSTSEPKRAPRASRPEVSFVGRDFVITREMEEIQTSGAGATDYLTLKLSTICPAVSVLLSLNCEITSVLPTIAPPSNFAVPGHPMYSISTPPVHFAVNSTI
jgi:hypothetical protein